MQLTAANEADVNTALPLVTEIPAVAGKPGRPKQKPDALVADKGFDCAALRTLISWLGIEPRIPHRGDSTRGLGRTRWFIERRKSWQHQFQGLRIRGDRKSVVEQVILILVAGVL